MIRSLLILITIIFISCNPETSEINSRSDSKDDLSSDYLISASESKLLLEQRGASIRLIHIGKKEAFEKEHIPGAYRFWRPDYTSIQNDSIKGMIADSSQMAHILQKISYEPESMLLIYGTKANVDAMRFAWILELYGIRNFKIINGGLQYWKQNSFVIVSGPEEQRAANDHKLEMQMDSRSYASFEDVREAISNDDYIIIDTREDYEFRGEPFIVDNKLYKFKSKAYDRGKIPGAIRLNWSQLVDLTGDHRIKSEKDLYYDLEQRGITKDKNIIVYCQSGSRSSNTRFILDHVLGFPNVRNYDGSWIEWSYYHTIKNSVEIEQLCNQDSFDILYTMLEDQLNDL